MERPIGDASGASSLTSGSESGGASAGSSRDGHRRVSDVAVPSNHRPPASLADRPASVRHPSSRPNGASAVTSGGSTSASATGGQEAASRHHGVAQRRHSSAVAAGGASAGPEHTARHNSPAFNSPSRHGPTLTGVASASSGASASAASGPSYITQNSIPGRQTQVSRSMRYRRDHVYPSITEGASAAGSSSGGPSAVGPASASKSLGGVRTDLERSNPSPTASAANSSASVKSQLTPDPAFQGSAHNPNKSEIPGRRGASYARSFKLPKVNTMWL